MFKKRSQGEIQEQKPVPAEGVQLGGGADSMPGGKPWDGEQGKPSQWSLWNRNATLPACRK